MPDLFRLFLFVIGRSKRAIAPTGSDASSATLRPAWPEAGEADELPPRFSASSNVGSEVAEVLHNA
jgi:hypothetical protein